MEQFLAPSSADVNLTELILSPDAADGIFQHLSIADGLGFFIITALGLALALVYIPIRLFLTITARSRRLKLLQRIRKLRESINEPIENND
jgi:hypothetical protein